MKLLFIVLSIIIVGCNGQTYSYQEKGKKCQEEALKEYLKENAILEEPIIISNITQLSDDQQEFHGAIKFKFANSKRVQVAKCYSIRQLTSEWFDLYNYTFICGTA